MPRSHQTFHPVRAMKLLGIMLRNRCWPTTFHTTLAKDADEWCRYLHHYFHAPKWMALQCWLRPCSKFNPISIKIHAPITPNFTASSSHELVMLRNTCGLTIFHIITSGDANEWCCYLQHYFHAPSWSVLRYWLHPDPQFNPSSIKICVSITPNFLSGLSHESAGDYVEK